MAKRTYYGSIQAGEDKDFGFNWAAELTASGSDTISSSTWVVSPASAGLTLDQKTNSTTATACYVTESGATVGAVFELENTITTAAGRVMIADWRLTVVD